MTVLGVGCGKLHVCSMSMFLLIFLIPPFFAGRHCETKPEGKPIPESISDDDEKCSGTSWLESSSGSLQSAIEKMVRSDPVVEPKFLCFSRRNDQEPCLVTDANDSAWNAGECGFDATAKTVFIIHGFKDTYAPWTRTLKDALIQQEDCNVFIVECGQMSETYSDVLKKIPKVGKQVAGFIRNLQKSKGLDLRQVHIIGHSAGAHTAGFAGKEIKKTEKRPIGRITGLDPAGPGFYNATPDLRLDATDASFVDIIHTNMGCSRLEGFGYPYAVGHFDFYPNGGKMQPGCLTMLEILGKMNFRVASIFLKYMFGKIEQPERQHLTHLLCSHAMSHALFTASVWNANWALRSVQCSSWERYRSGQCDGNEQVIMGYYADRFRGLAEDRSKKFYLQTHS